MRVNFGKLKSVLRSPGCKTKSSKDSSECLCEYTSLLANYIEKSQELTEEELAMSIMSMQNWILRKDYTTCKAPVNIGDIFIADLGNCYKPEFAYPHPVVVLEKISGLLLIAPVSSTPNVILSAYHPTDNPNGNENYRKVYKHDGFIKDSAVIISNVRTISPGRLLEKKGNLLNITDDNSVFVDIKEKALKLCFPKQFINYRNVEENYIKILEDNAKLKEEIALLRNDN